MARRTCWAGMVVLALVLGVVGCTPKAGPTSAELPASPSPAAKPAPVQPPAAVVLGTCVVGLKEANFFADEEMSKPPTTLPAGTALTVWEARPEVLKVTTPDGKAGWVRCFMVCSPEELQRRKTAGELPESSVCVGAHGDSIFLHDGAMSVENGKPVVSNLEAFWMDPSAKGKTLTIDSNKLLGDPDVLYLLKGKKIRKLTFWHAPKPQ